MTVYINTSIQFLIIDVRGGDSIKKVKNFVLLSCGKKESQNIKNNVT